MKKILLFMAFLAFTANSFAQTTAHQVEDITQCSYEVFDLTVQTPLTLGDQDEDEFTVTYHLSGADAENGTNAIPNPQAFIIGGYEKLIHIRVQNNIDGSFDTTTFLITLMELIPAPEFDDVEACSSYILPYLQWPALYYTEPNLAGQQLASGTVITTTQTIYIHVVNGVCNDESSFTVTITGEGPYIMPPNPLVQCDANGDGMEIFNLWELLNGIAEIDGVASVSLHETQTDAEEDINAIPNTDAYANINYGIQTVYIRAVSDTGCVNVLPLQLVTFECPTNNSFSGHVKYDSNGDGCDYNDPPAAGVWVSYTHDNSVYYAYTDINGYYEFNNVPDGISYASVEAVAGFNISPQSMTVSFPGGTDPVDNDFCITSQEPVQDIQLYMYPAGFAVPGFEATYVVVLENVGSTTVSGEITITYDASNLTFIPTPGITQSGNTLTISYSNLSGFQMQYYVFSGILAAPPALNIGDVITFTGVANPVTGDVYPENNTFVLNHQIVNSYDPNDIACREGEFITEEQADGYLHYMVRFQNTGTFPATNVRVEGMLDNNLDWETFEPIGASHNYHAFREGNSIRFMFDNIMLADSTSNEAASHGYVMYKIKPKATVQLGDTMSAQAGIYFDFNTAVITNNYTTTIVTMGNEAVSEEMFAVYPNPANGMVNIRLNGAESANVSITDVLGKTVLRAQVGHEGSLDISALNSGVYFVTVQAGSAQSTQKLIVR